MVRTEAHQTLQEQRAALLPEEPEGLAVPEAPGEQAEKPLREVLALPGEPVQPGQPGGQAASELHRQPVGLLREEQEEQAGQGPPPGVREQQPEQAALRQPEPRSRWTQE
jgi:hypothetical protein